jgi:hypothetical protein
MISCVTMVLLHACVSPSLQSLKQVTNFHETSYYCHVIKGHTNFWDGSNNSVI